MHKLVASSAFACALLSAHCGLPAKTVENGIVDLSNAVCTALVASVPSPTVDFLCSVENAAAGVVSQFQVRIAAEDARNFALKHAGPAGATDAGTP
jgi:hypothetical protein